jgi:signal peptidase I
MLDDGEREDEAPSWEEEGAEAEPYDPLFEPWHDPSAAAIIEYRLGQGEAAILGRPAIGRGAASVAAPVDEFSELRQRLRAQTVVVPRRRRIWSVTLRELAETLLLAVLIFMAVRASMQNFRVDGASMEPSLDDGEYLIVNKLAYTEIDLSLFDWLPFFDSGDNPIHHLWDVPNRGDVIVFRAPTNTERDFIKRVIGVPGDVVEVDAEKSQVLINGEAIDEPYISGTTSCTSSCGPWTVPAGAYFVMGDNRRNSSDSRQGWFVPEENIIGKALITYWHDNSPELDLAPNHDVSPVSEAAAEE